MQEVGKFVSFMFRKSNYETMIADVLHLGQFIKFEGATPAEFVPCP